MMIDMSAPTPKPELISPKVICLYCKTGTPKVELIQENYQIYVNSYCTKCEKTSKNKIDEYLSELEKSETNLFCQKKGGEHKERKAVIAYNGFYYCKECFDHLKEFVEINNFVGIEEFVDQCEGHKRPYKFYCKTCKKKYL